MKTNLTIADLKTRIDDPPLKWLIPHYVHTFYLPTEFVVKEPQVAAPRTGKFYEVDLRLLDGKLVPYKVLQKSAGFPDNVQGTQIYLYEIYADCGDDGHTDYKLIHWMLHHGIYQGDPSNIYNEIDGLYERGF